MTKAGKLAIILLITGHAPCGWAEVRSSAAPEVYRVNSGSNMEFYDRFADPYQLTNLIGLTTPKQTVELNCLHKQLTVGRHETCNTVPDALSTDSRKRVKTDPEPVYVSGKFPSNQ